jgi:hypothetical protein
MAQDPTRLAGDLVARLRGRGHHTEAEHLARLLSPRTVERGLLLTLREACETILTAIEAVDPATEAMIEELRLEVEKRLRPAPTPGGRP